jgi:hypothetical protein
MFLTILAPANLFYGAAHPKGVIAYLIAAISWYISNWLLEYEYVRDQN